MNSETLKNLEGLIDVLTCPECKDAGNLLILQDATTEHLTIWKQLLPEEGDIRLELVCCRCQRAYPITQDGIPIIWSDVLKETFVDLESTIDTMKVSERDVKAANINVYEDVIGRYYNVGVHADSVTESRLLSALEISNKDLDGWHLDVGCGAGNVLQMTNGTKLSPKVGLDISLSALRLVMKKGFHVVLGDAEKLRFNTKSMELISASSVLHHLYDPSRLISEASRVLKPKGLFLTDFDPNMLAADWSWVVRKMYAARLPVYRILSKSILRKKVSHIGQRTQMWNEIAEFHNRPGSGFSSSELSSSLEQSGLCPLLIYLHNRGDSLVINSRFIVPSVMHFFIQVFSGRNPFLRKNAHTLLTLSMKPEIV